MRAFIVVEGEVVSQSCSESWYGFVVLQIDVFVFNRTPETLNEDVVEDPTSAIHADADAFLSAVAAYRASDDVDQLIKTWDKLVDRFPDTEWGKRAAYTRFVK